MRDKLQGIWDAIVFCNDNAERYAHIDLDKIDSDFIAIDNALERLEKQDKILKIIKNFIHLEFEYDNLQTPHFTISANGKAHIEKETFDLLKEWLK